MYLTDSCDRGLGGANIASCPTYIVSFVYFSCWVYLDIWEELSWPAPHFHPHRQTIKLRTALLLNDFNVLGYLPMTKGK